MCNRFSFIHCKVNNYFLFLHKIVILYEKFIKENNKISCFNSDYISYMDIMLHAHT